MKYVVEFKDKEIVLPQYTIDIVDKIEKADKINMSDNRPYKEKVKALLDLEYELVGKDIVDELVGGELNSCDPNDVQILFILIIRAYDKPIDDINAERDDDVLEQLGQIKDTAEALNDVPDTFDKVSDKVDKANRMSR